MNDKFRFDDSTQSIYEYDKAQQGYLYKGSYLQFGVTQNMTDETKARVINSADDDSYDLDEQIRYHMGFAD